MILWGSRGVHYKKPHFCLGAHCLIILLSDNWECHSQDSNPGLQTEKSKCNLCGMSHTPHTHTPSACHGITSIDLSNIERVLMVKLPVHWDMNLSPSNLFRGFYGIIPSVLIVILSTVPQASEDYFINLLRFGVNIICWLIEANWISISWRQLPFC